MFCCGVEVSRWDTGDMHEVRRVALDGGGWTVEGVMSWGVLDIFVMRRRRVVF